jgi:hypothetical protein
MVTQQFVFNVTPGVAGGICALRCRVVEARVRGVSLVLAPNP